MKYKLLDGDEIDLSGFSREDLEYLFRLSQRSAAGKTRKIERMDGRYYRG